MRYLLKVSLISAVTLLFLGFSDTKEIKLTEGIQPGHLAPGINLQEFNGKRTNYVLVQFWAAYEPQSRVWNTQMHNVIAQSGIDDLQLVSISFDENQSVFEGVVKADNLNEETQFNEPVGKKSALFKTFRLKNGFGNWLIDSNGIIVARNIRPDEILARISNLR